MSLSALALDTSLGLSVQKLKACIEERWKRAAFIIVFAPSITS
jgi:hypothetical protein